MKVARVVVLGIALGAGVAAALLAMNLSRPAPPPAVEKAAAGPSIETVEVLVAKENIPVGAKIDAAMLEWRTWPAAGLSSTYVSRSSSADAMTEVSGTLAKSSFFEGEPITKAKLVHTDSGFMSAILPAGKLAVATSISADTGAGGFILPNDRVDVIMTRQVQTNNGGQSGDRYDTETILFNVRILAIDQTIEDKDGEKVVIGQTATLELTPQQAEIITVARQISARLTLALRSVADAETRMGNDAAHLIGAASSGGVTVVRNGVTKEYSVNK
jgi:pilus assembly protein CpaB